MGSRPSWGAEPWPPMPWMRTSMEVELARAGPVTIADFAGGE